MQQWRAAMRLLWLMTTIVLLVAPISPASSEGTSSPHISIDQYGYRSMDQKIAILRNPIVGYDAPNPYAPGTVIEVRRAADDQVVLAGPPSSWNGGSIHDQSGDQIWWFDFSEISETGPFYVWDPDNGASSEIFDISPDPYRDVRRQAARVYYYQRCGTPKDLPHAEPGWTDEACHLGPEQDLDCRFVLDPDPGTSLDLSGGWHDAGDYNKYVNYADGPVHQLLDAYEIAPGAWGEDLTIPETGNGVPDLLDEVRWELEWMLKMQAADGSVLHKVSVTGWQSASPPSADAAARYYAPPTASATISACGAFAHSAQVFGSLGDTGFQGFAATLEAAALAAWSWCEENPGEIPSSYDNTGFTSSSAEDSSYEQEMNRLRAAAHLLRLTGETVYRDWVDAHYQEAHLFQWGYAMSWEETAQSGLLRYATLAEATPIVATEIFAAYEAALAGGSLLGEVLAETDAYRGHMYDQDYTWGNNGFRAILGEMFASMVRLGLDPSQADLYREAAAGHLHFIHGVNPTGYSFLTHMDDHGAAGSVREIYHGWFGDGTVWDNADSSLYGPAPGYLTGGINPNYAPDGAYQGPPIEPPMNQPIQKSYRDWNTSWPENSWEITEPAIYYQSSYLRLLASFSDDELTSAQDPAIPTKDASARIAFLRNSHPNPFEYNTRIVVELAAPDEIELAVLDTRGRRVTTLINGTMTIGRHRVTWTGRDARGHRVAAGTYYLLLVGLGQTQTQKISLVR